MKIPSLSLRIGLGLTSLWLMGSATLSAEGLSGAVELTTLGAACPPGMAAPGTPVTVRFMLPDGLEQGAFAAAQVTMKGEFRDVAVQGCTIGFAGSTADALTLVSGGAGLIAHQRGCRGYCGL